jgi:hypothetical protein
MTVGMTVEMIAGTLGAMTVGISMTMAPKINPPGPKIPPSATTAGMIVGIAETMTVGIIVMIGVGGNKLGCGKIIVCQNPWFWPWVFLGETIFGQFNK